MNKRLNISSVVAIAALLVSAMQANAAGGHSDGWNARHNGPDMNSLRAERKAARQAAQSNSVEFLGPPIQIDPLPPIIGVHPILPGDNPPGRGHRKMSHRIYNKLNGNNSVFVPADFDWNGSLKGIHKLNLDLTSSSEDIILGSKIFKGGATSVTLTIGGVEKEFAAGSHVTPAEYVAIKDALAGQEQQLTIDANGTAVGGSFTLNSSINPRVCELVIPEGVTAYDFFSSNKALGVRGDLLNYGSIYGVSVDNRVHSGILYARDFINESAGTISTILPESLAQSIPGAVSNVSLNLLALNSISNRGQITSSGSLTLATATGGISSARPNIWVFPPHDDDPGKVYPMYIIYQPGPAPVISAVGDVNISAGNGYISNGGNIVSHNGSINLSTAQATDMYIYGGMGTFEAGKGDINIRSPLFTGTNSAFFGGGDYFANSLNIYSGSGKIQGYIGDAPAKINTVGDASDFKTGVAGDIFVTKDGLYSVPPPQIPEVPTSMIN